MNARVLITGGAGFIGSHLADELLARGYSVRALDSLDPQVHGPNPSRPKYLARDVDLIVGDVRDPGAVRSALKNIDVVFHLAARVGVGQSLYAIGEYTSVNNLGTAVLLEALIKQPVRRLVVASTMAIYGEGLYRDGEEHVYASVQRSVDQLSRGEWDPRGPEGQQLAPVPTPESKTPSLASIYSLSKYDQERMCLIAGAAYKIPTVALRFFNVYGQRQALSNPYSGVLAIFATRCLNRKAPLIFEDGRQRRDFVHVYDVATACRLAAETPGAIGDVFNIGSGEALTITEVATRMARVLNVEITPEITGQYRVGDVRHCTADIRHARAVLGYRPQITFNAGLTELATWLTTQRALHHVDTMRAVASGVAL